MTRSFGHAHQRRQYVAERKLLLQFKNRYAKYQRFHANR